MDASQAKPIKPPVKADKEESLIVRLKLAAKSNREIGRVIGMSKDAIATRLKRPNVRALIEYGARREAMRVPDACDVLDQSLHSDDEAIRVKVADSTLKNMGISTPHAPQFVLNLYQDQRIQVLSPHVQALLTDHFAQVIDGQVIEDKFDSDIKGIGE